MCEFMTFALEAWETCDKNKFMSKKRPKAYSRSLCLIMSDEKNITLLETKIFSCLWSIFSIGYMKTDMEIPTNVDKLIAN